MTSQESQHTKRVWVRYFSFSEKQCIADIDLKQVLPIDFKVIYVEVKRASGMMHIYYETALPPEEGEFSFRPLITGESIGVGDAEGHYKHVMSCNVGAEWSPLAYHLYQKVGYEPV